MRIEIKPDVFVLVDEQDAELVRSHKWQVNPRYVMASIESRTVYLHRLIMNAPKGMCVDHINGNRLDNRRANLRLVTQAQNLQNRRGAQSTSSTGIRGVFPFYNNRYRARIWVNGRGISLGCFDTAEEAEAAAIEGRRKHMTHSQEAAC